jgi:hypothetical protein
MTKAQPGVTACCLTQALSLQFVVHFLENIFCHVWPVPVLANIGA